MNASPVTVYATYVMRCSFCVHGTHTDEHLIPRGGEFPWPSLPDGWRVVDGEPVCPAHEVTIRRKEAAA